MRIPYTDPHLRIYISWIVAFLSFFFIRASVMLFTLRLLPLTKMWSQRIIYVTLVLNFAITLAATASYGVRCSPSKPVPASVLLITMQVNGSESIAKVQQSRRLRGTEIIE